MVEPNEAAKGGDESPIANRRSRPKRRGGDQSPIADRESRAKRRGGDQLPIANRRSRPKRRSGDQSPIADRQSRAKRRGGKRPGAGAPRGNMNALKTGAYSKQFALLGRLLAEDPKIRTVLLDIAAKAGRKFKHANEVAAFLLTRYADHIEARAEAKYAPKGRKHRARKRAPSADEGADRLNLELPVDDWDSIKKAAARFEQKWRKSKFSPLINQSPHTKGKNQSVPTHEMSID